MSGRGQRRSPFEPAFEQLPETIPIFPLAGALLLPGGRLPLNIFEPRYVSMVLDSLAGHRLIGMVQPARPGGFAGDGLPTGDGPPPVRPIGCAGRVVQFTETDDGRLLITLAGLIRFEVGQELPALPAGYRRVMPRFERFRADLDADDAVVEIDRQRLMTALQGFFRAHKLSTDWKAVQDAADRNLVTSLSMVLPFGPDEKQALLEAADGAARAKLLVALLEMGARGDDGAGSVSRH
ncbi:MAG: LON peptidase substrate-binding domain-containing protein [Rhodospirillales bacterium]|nr:MAG: LON peptidase substrate-binding domain-containing protein [Rhodospirillales bacterium]